MKRAALLEFLLLSGQDLIANKILIEDYPSKSKIAIAKVLGVPSSQPLCKKKLWGINGHKDANTEIALRKPGRGKFFA